MSRARSGQKRYLGWAVGWGSPEGHPCLWGDEVAREVPGDGLRSKPAASHCMGMGVSCLIINLRVMGRRRGQRI